MTSERLQRPYIMLNSGSVAKASWKTSARVRRSECSAGRTEKDMVTVGFGYAGVDRVTGFERR